MLPACGEARLDRMGAGELALLRWRGLCNTDGMFRMVFIRFALGLGALLLVATHRPSLAQMRVDLELVLTVDISLSMDLDEQRLQRDGYIAAFRDRELHQSIASGPLRKIAVTYVEWAGPHVQLIVMPWTLIDSPAAAIAFADKLEQVRISRERMTSITAALEFSGKLFQSNPFQGARQVIDVSGDGPNNAGGPVTRIRDELVGKGIVINGLPIKVKHGGGINSLVDLPDLDRYYNDCVIGGPGSFMIPILAKEEFLPAIRRKLLLEIAGLEPPARVIKVQAAPEPRRADCLIGEKLWNRYMDGNRLPQ